MGSHVVEEGKDVLCYNRTAETSSNCYRCKVGKYVLRAYVLRAYQQEIPMVYPVLEEGKYVPYQPVSIVTSYDSLPPFWRR